MSNGFPIVRLGEVLTPVERPEHPVPGKAYRQVGVKLWGQGAYERDPIDGAQTRYRALWRVETGDIILNKIWARNGSVAVVPESLAGRYVSNEFPTFAAIGEKLEPRWFHWLTKTRMFWEQCDKKSRGTSGKNRIRPERFLEIEIPLPPQAEQRRIVARIEKLAAKIVEAGGLRKEAGSSLRGILLSTYSEITKGAPCHPMSEIAPLRRRPVEIDPSEKYYELGIRSFGNGTFHKPPIDGASLGTKKLFRIEANDLLFNIVFAWEGAVAVAKPRDHGRVGSHRFLTCVPKEGLATSTFLCFHFLTDQGLEQLGKASPGGAGRNRTLGLKTLDEIPVPVPSFERQLWFESLLCKSDSLRRMQAETTAELNALLPSILDRAFKGEL